MVELLPILSLPLARTKLHCSNPVSLFLPALSLTPWRRGSVCNLKCETITTRMSSFSLPSTPSSHNTAGNSPVNPELENVQPGKITGMDIEAQFVTTDKTRIKVYCISDLHADAEKNQIWVREKCTRKDPIDVFTVMILPGDIGTEVDRIASVFDVLTANFDRVCFVPGNHELWRRGIAAGGSATRPELREENNNRMAADSLEKMKEILTLARTKGVFVGPLRIQLGGKNGGEQEEEEEVLMVVVVLMVEVWLFSLSILGITVDGTRNLISPTLLT